MEPLSEAAGVTKNSRLDSTVLSKGRKKTLIQQCVYNFLIKVIEILKLKRMLEKAVTVRKILTLIKIRPKEKRIRKDSLVNYPKYSTTKRT